MGYYGRSQLLKIKDNLNNNQYLKEILEHKVIPSLQRIPGAVYQQNNTTISGVASVRLPGTVEKNTSSYSYSQWRTSQSVKSGRAGKACCCPQLVQSTTEEDVHRDNLAR
ncbi:hypothetical protein TNCV_2093161 [Trichonephila clavipes]|nr:hypothetical protein TNCV_2093161 [Trichonephila clavipes]